MSARTRDSPLDFSQTRRLLHRFVNTISDEFPPLRSSVSHRRAVMDYGRERCDIMITRLRFGLRVSCGRWFSHIQTARSLQLATDRVLQTLRDIHTEELIDMCDDRSA